MYRGGRNQTQSAREKLNGSADDAFIYTPKTEGETGEATDDAMSERVLCVALSVSPSVFGHALVIAAL